MADDRGQIAVFLPSLAGGGAERVIVTLINAFARRGLAVDLVLVKAEGPYLTEIDERVRIVDLRCRRAMSALPRLSAYIRRERPRALLSALDYANVIAIAANLLSFRQTRVIACEHNSLRMPNVPTSRKQRLKLFLARRLYQHAGQVVAVSIAMAKQVQDAFGLPDGKTTVIYNPIDTPRITRLARENTDHAWLDDPEIPVILGVGRLTAQKDFSTLIQAFARLCKLRPCRLVILGEGDDLRRLSAQAKSLGVDDLIDMPGFAQNPYPYFKNASVFALSSRWEGLPVALLEAMACGTRVVSTDCPTGPAEIVAATGFGHLVPPGDPEALAKALDAALCEPRPNATEIELDRFDLNTVVQQYLDVLQAEHFMGHPQPAAPILEYGTASDAPR